MYIRDMLKPCGLLLLATTAICSACLIYWVFGDSIADEITVLQRKRDLPAVELEFNATLDDLPQSETDIVLATHTDGLTIEGGIHRGCITGKGEIIYSTTREFADVIEEYEALFEDRETWTQSNLSRTLFYTEKARFLLLLREPGSFPYPSECVGSPICYSTQLYYADPAYSGCSG